MKINVTLEFESPEEEAAFKEPTGKAFRVICAQETNKFDSYLKATDPEFREGLYKTEVLAITGYIYQKCKGHIDNFFKGH